MHHAWGVVHPVLGRHHPVEPDDADGGPGEGGLRDLGPAPLAPVHGAHGVDEGRLARVLRPDDPNVPARRAAHGLDAVAELVHPVPRKGAHEVHLVGRRHPAGLDAPAHPLREAVEGRNGRQQVELVDGDDDLHGWAVLLPQLLHGLPRQRPVEVPGVHHHHHHGLAALLPPDALPDLLPKVEARKGRLALLVLDLPVVVEGVAPRAHDARPHIHHIAGLVAQPGPPLLGRNPPGGLVPLALALALPPVVFVIFQAVQVVPGLHQRVKGVHSDVLRVDLYLHHALRTRALRGPRCSLCPLLFEALFPLLLHQHLLHLGLQESLGDHEEASSLGVLPLQTDPAPRALLWNVQTSLQGAH
mmetsp:Transcript_64242/g.203206  ORF Transcript_64242/g.203206 Transcript_64242/m.203206 type:complete len:358 (-) Transcript_64242:290-1363(-)